GVHTPVERLPAMSSPYPVSIMRHCRYHQCEKRANFNVEGGSKKAVYCKQHADDGMVDVINKRCLHESCTTRPAYNFEGSRTAAYCKQHADNGMVNVRNKRCLHES
ncbi:unnamed protein product, partial [Laminaria digitata]